MRLECVAEGAVDRERERQRLGRRLDGARRRSGPSSATAAGERGASGAHHLRGASRAAAGGRRRVRRSRTRALARRGSPPASSRARARARSRRATRRWRASGSRSEVGPHVGGRAVGGLDVGAGVAEVADGARGGARPADASRAPSRRARARARERRCGIVAGGALVADRPARLESALATQPEGDGTLIPRPLSSQTKSSGTGRCWWAACAVVLSAACAVAWFSDASPKLQTTIASPGQALGTPSLRARSIAIATPTARGRWEAIVEVCGMTASS